MLNQKGFSAVVLILGIFLLGVVAAGVYLYNNNTNQATTSPATKDSEVLTRDNKVSPTGEYIVVEESVADTQKISIKDNKNNVIAENVITLNEKEIGYNTKIRCQCGTSFQKWIDNTHFTIKVINGGGEEYDFTVDATTGKVVIDQTESSKTLNYSLPSGWKTVMSTNGSFEIGYDPNSWTAATYPDYDGVILALQSGGTPFIIYKKDYDGGSRHKFILNGETMDMVSTANTKEISYSVGGRSGLVLYGINFSAATTMGMLNIDGKSALWFSSTSDQSTTEKLLSTLKFF